MVVVLIAFCNDRKDRETGFYREHALVYGPVDDIFTVLADFRQFLSQNGFHILERVCHVHTDRDRDPGIHLGQVDDVVDVLIAEDPLVASAPDDSCASHADVLDHAPVAVDIDNVAYLIFTFEDGRDTCEDIGDQVCRAHGHADTENSDRSQDRIGIHADVGQGIVYKDQHSHITEHIGDQLTDRLSPRIEHSADRPDDKPHDHKTHEDTDGKKKDSRERKQVQSFVPLSFQDIRDQDVLLPPVPVDQHEPDRINDQQRDTEFQGKQSLFTGRVDIKSVRDRSCKLFQSLEKTFFLFSGFFLALLTPGLCRLDLEKLLIAIYGQQIQAQYQKQYRKTDRIYHTIPEAVPHQSVIG